MKISKLVSLIGVGLISVTGAYAIVIERTDDAARASEAISAYQNAEMKDDNSTSALVSTDENGDQTNGHKKHHQRHSERSSSRSDDNVTRFGSESTDN